jgi:hypothetical protein
MDLNWVHEQVKDNLSTLINESLNNQWIYKFPIPDWFEKAEFLPNVAVVKKHHLNYVENKYFHYQLLAINNMFII